MALLQVSGLVVAGPGRPPLLCGVDLEVGRGEILFLVGPSGAGKSLTLLALAGLLPPGLAARGQIRLNGSELSHLSPGARRNLLGKSLSLVFQEPLRALDPAMTVGAQVAEAFRCRWGWGRAQATEAAARALARVGLGSGGADFQAYPHRLSGGMRQRVLLAAHLGLHPDLLLLDEPTAALDPIRAADLAAQVRAETRQRGMGAIWVSHDPRLASALGDRQLRLDQGRVTTSVAAASAHAPGEEAPGLEPGRPLLQAVGLGVRLQGREILADVDLALCAGRVTALVGPSGAGKSTLIRALAGLVPLHAGRVEGHGRVLLGSGRRPGPSLRRLVQPLFQDPGGSLNPRRRLGPCLLEGLRLAGLPKRPEDVAALLAEVGLPENAAERYPHQLSGGERQRAALARALSVRPAVLLLDEPFSALDPPLRVELVQALRRLARAGRSVLLVSHHLGDALAAADHLGVLVGGRIVEWGGPGELLENPIHPWTKVLRESFFRPGQAPPDWALGAAPAQSGRP